MIRYKVEKELVSCFKYLSYCLGKPQKRYFSGRTTLKPEKNPRKSVTLSLRGGGLKKHTKNSFFAATALSLKI